jgi:hypothetical protein
MHLPAERAAGRYATFGLNSVMLSEPLAGSWLALRFPNLDRRQPLAPQHIGHRARTSALQHALDEFAAGVACFVGEGGHG